VVIFPEHDCPYNHIVSEFQDKFIDVARLYYKKSGKALSFLPIYIAPDAKKICFGAPIAYEPGNSIAAERSRISRELMEAITRLALELPPHRVVPYRNIPRRKQGVSRQ